MTVSERIHRANAAVECEKLMSRHVYLHAAGIHREEIENYWTKSDECTWAHNFGQMGDKQNYTRNYADMQERNVAQNFAEVSGVYPELLDREKVPDRRATFEEAMHFTASPIIEVAEDGQTAKGLFYTPGCIFSTLNPEQAREGTWMWERYGADFVLEDGKWLFKNLKVCCDMGGPMDLPNWPLLPKEPPPPPAEGEEAESAMDITHPGPLHWEIGPTQMPQTRPFMPVPYSTFSETYALSALTGVYEEK
jgi:hypothetical protein